MRDFECNGIWWLPDDSSQQVAGRLSFSDAKGITLALSGSLGSPWTGDTKRVQTILGAVWDAPSSFGQDVTLLNSWAKSRHFGSMGFNREDYHVDRILFGDHIQSVAELQFGKLRAQYSGLSSWAADFTGFSSDDSGLAFRWTRPDDIQGTFSQGKLALGFGLHANTTIRERTLRETVGFSLVLDSPATIENINARYVSPLQNFLTLATDHNNSLTQLVVRRLDSHADVRVFGARVFSDEQEAAELFPHEMLFTASDLGRDEIIPVIARWFDVTETYRSASDVYFGGLSKPDTFMDIQFFNVFQALQLFANRKFGPTPVEASSAWLVRLVFDNWLVMAPLLVDQLQSVGEIVRLRNYVVHRDESAERQSNLGEQLYWWTQRLKTLMKACLLSELRFAPTRQLELLRRNRVFVHLEGMPKNWVAPQA